MDMTTPSMKRMEQTSPDGSVRCCDNGDMDEKHECLKQLPTPDSEWEKEFDNYKLMEYGKWRIDRAVAKHFFKELITSVRSEERERAISKIPTVAEFFVGEVDARCEEFRTHAITAIKGEGE
jgi:hypothetical protein